MLHSYLHAVLKLSQTLAVNRQEPCFCWRASPVIKMWGELRIKLSFKRFTTPSYTIFAHDCMYTPFRRPCFYFTYSQSRNLLIRTGHMQYVLSMNNSLLSIELKLDSFENTGLLICFDPLSSIWSQPISNVLALELCVTEKWLFL